MNPEKPEFTAIPTEYHGVMFRSRFEAQCALLFDKLRWPWEYEPKSFLLANGVAYTPDFFLPEIGAIVECRGYESKKGRAQIEGFSKEFDRHGYRFYVVIPSSNHPVSPTIYRGFGDIRLSEEGSVSYCPECAAFRFVATGRCCSCSGRIENSAGIWGNKGKVHFFYKPSDEWEDTDLFSPAMHKAYERWARLCEVFRLIDRMDLVRELSYIGDGKAPDFRYTQGDIEQSLWLEIRTFAELLFPGMLATEDTDA